MSDMLGEDQVRTIYMIAQISYISRMYYDITNRMQKYMTQESREIEGEEFSSLTGELDECIRYSEQFYDLQRALEVPLFVQVETYMHIGMMYRVRSVFMDWRESFDDDE